MDLITFFGIISFGIIWAGKFQPLEDFKNWLGIGENLRYKSKYKFGNYILKWLHKICNCYSIIPYIMLLMTGSIWLSLIGYVIADIIVNAIDFFHTNIKY